jgi:hypothetical protein
MAAPGRNYEPKKDSHLLHYFLFGTSLSAKIKTLHLTGHYFTQSAAAGYGRTTSSIPFLPPKYSYG